MHGRVFYTLTASPTVAEFLLHHPEENQMRAIATFLIASAALAGDDKSPSAFRFKQDKAVHSSIELKEVRRGIRGTSDPRDKIPSIRKPKYATPKEAPWLQAGDRVLGLVVGKEARAYPLKILQVHEMVNDVLGGIPVGPNY